MAAAKPTSVLPLNASRVGMLLQACEKGSCEEVEVVLGKERSQEDRTALVNSKIKETGLTALHRVCQYGHHHCIPLLLKHKADPRIWDHCGLTPLHCAASGNHRQCVDILLKSEACGVNEPTEYGETPFLIACLNGSTDVARYLYEDCQCGMPPVDGAGNTVLHYATASDSPHLLLWLLSFPEIKPLIDTPNKRGHTPLSHACSLGCTKSLAALLHHNVSVTSSLPPLSLPHTLTHSQLALQLGNSYCYGIIEDSRTPPPLPHISTSASFTRQDSQVSEQLRRGSSSGLQLYPLRTNSSGSRGSLLSTTAGLQRRGSLLGTSRPVTLTVRRSSSLRRGSGDEEKKTYLRSRNSATQLSQCLESQNSRSLDQLLYDSTAYEPPPDIIFTPPIEREALSASSRKFYSSKHSVKLRVSQEYWTEDNKSHMLTVCLCAAMHYSQTFPRGYTVVGPICFLSCRSKGPCQVKLTLPHAVKTSEEDPASRLVILSTATAKINADSNSPFFSPSERVLAPLEGAELSVDERSVTFQTDLHHPSLFAVAVRDGPGSIPLPLRCCLYVLYPKYEPEITMVTGFDIETYIGMNIQTVATAVTSWAEKHSMGLEETHFVMSGEQVVVTASLLPAEQTDWEVECRGDGKFHYTQVSLTQHTDRDTYSHQLVYPHRERFFIEPRIARSAVKCRMSVSNTIRELCYVKVIPYSPRKETTPEPALSPEHRHSLPLFSTLHQPPTSLFPDHRHSLPLSTISAHASQLNNTSRSPSPVSHPLPFIVGASSPSPFSTTTHTLPPPSSTTSTTHTSPPRSSTTSTTHHSLTPPSSTNGTTHRSPPPSTIGTTHRSPPPSTNGTTHRSPPPSTTGTTHRSPPPPSSTTSTTHRSPPPPSTTGTIPHRSPLLYLRLPNGNQHHSESQV